MCPSSGGCRCTGGAMGSAEGSTPSITTQPINPYLLLSTRHAALPRTLTWPPIAARLLPRPRLKMTQGRLAEPWHGAGAPGAQRPSHRELRMGEKKAFLGRSVGDRILLGSFSLVIALVSWAMYLYFEHAEQGACGGLSSSRSPSRSFCFPSCLSSGPWRPRGSWRSCCGERP